MKTLQRIEARSFHKTVGLARSLQGNRELRLEVNQYGKRKPGPRAVDRVVINRTQNRRVVCK